MSMYQQYCDRRAIRKGPVADNVACCPLRVPIIGLIFFSLLVFTPFLIPSGETNISQRSESAPMIERSSLSHQESSAIVEVPEHRQDASFRE